MEENKKDKLLKIIVEEYIRSAEPIGSAFVAEKYLKDSSPATVRNHMAELEDEGLIFQPHTSAGRVPTLEGYKYYLANLLDRRELGGKNKKVLDESKKNFSDGREGVKALAKAIAELANSTVLVGFSPLDVYYTGLANLFRQPEFAEHAQVYNMSDVIDHLDEVMAKVFFQLDDEIKILVGAENPFGEMSSVVLTRCQIEGREGLLGIMGPSRMNYEENFGLVAYGREILKKV